MADSDFESKSDEMERESLQKAIADVEKALAASPPGTRMALTNFVENAKGRVAALDKKIKESQAERQSRMQEQTSTAILAQKEAALSASEKQTYSEFLSKESFTKKDFNSLETFYAHTWDRLSEGGKDQMSHRIWEGVRRDEYKFSELPATVREKETERAYSVLKKRDPEPEKENKVFEADRQDFIRAYEDGKRSEASKILDRESFRENMFKGRESASRSHSIVDRGEEAGKSAGVERLKATATTEPPKQAPEGAKEANRDLAALGLDNVKLVDAESQGTSADIPNGNAGVQRQSTRGG